MNHNNITHIIHRQVFDLQLPSNSFDGSIEDDIRDSYYASLPEIENILAAFDDPHRITTIDNIFLDLGRLDILQLTEQFSKRFCEALKRALKESGINTVRNAGSTQARQSSDHVSFDKDFDTTESLVNEKISWEQIDNTRTIDIAKGIREAFLFYLRTGMLPWWISNQKKIDIEKFFLPALDSANSFFIHQLRRLLTTDKNALTRLIYQFSDRPLEQVIELLLPAGPGELAKIYDLLKQHVSLSRALYESDAASEIVTRLTFAIILSENKDVAARETSRYLQFVLHKRLLPAEVINQLTTSLRTIHTQEQKRSANSINRSLHEEESITFNKTQPASEEEEDHASLPLQEQEPIEAIINSDESISDFVYVDFAGLVILHPYFERFFESLGLLDNHQQFINKAAQMRAVYLLAFLANGELNPAETILPFCKFLCGLPLESPIIRSIQLSKYEIDECTELLQAVIGHWSVLQNTSPDGLREGFLDRKGKLDFTGEITVLHVEVKGQDVLLNRLPWGIGYIQLPWLSNAFTTTWN